MRVLLVEDDMELSTRLKSDLGRAGYAVDTADNGVDAQHLGEQEPYDAVILDLGLPGRPGLEVLKSWRAAGNKVPVLVLTARDAWYEKVDGFKAGADDYLSEPFHMEELLARLQALLRRSSGRAAGSTLSMFGVELDEARQAVHREGSVLELTGVEFRLLRYFMLHPGEVMSKTRLTEHVYEYDAERDSNVIEVYINRLRQKLGKDLIKTRRGQGYVFGEGH